MLERKLITVGIAAAGLLYVAAVHALAGLQYAKDRGKNKPEPVKVRKYSSHYRSQMENICIATASEKARTDKKHAAFTKLMYCDPYLDHGLAYMLMNEKNEAVGYILCAEDIERFLKDTKDTQRQIAQLGEPYEQRAWQEWNAYRRYAKEYPAHLHIDILEEYTGGGNGTKLMNTLIAQLKKDGVRGVCLGVSAKNERAVRFYQKCGFVIFEDFDGGYSMGMDLQEDA